MSKHLPQIRFIEYQEVEDLCARLGDRIRTFLSPEKLDQCTYVAIPRGGLIVLSFLSYLLNLRRDQIFPLESFNKDHPLVIVDDCCLSGARFATYIKNFPDRKIVFAHLLSTPGVRQSILDNEKRVLACLAAENLIELELPASIQTEEFHRKNSNVFFYWFGYVAPFAFPWAEPDTTIWNGNAKRFESWHRLPPRMCLESRAELNVPYWVSQAISYNVPSHVYWRAENDLIWLMHLGNEKIYLLKDVSAAIWRALATLGDLDLTKKFILQTFEVEEQQLEKDLHGYLEDLLAKGLIERIS